MQEPDLPLPEEFEEEALEEVGDDGLEAEVDREGGAPPAHLDAALEALVFASPHPLPTEEAHAVINEVMPGALHSVGEAEERLQQLALRYAQGTSGFILSKSGGGWQFLTRPDLHFVLAAHHKQTAKRRLSGAALEVLSMVAYRQPITKPELEALRGVSCDYALQRLLERELVAIVGKSDAPGRPLLYATTARFMDHLGINSLSELPKLPAVEGDTNTLGAPLFDDGDDAPRLEPHGGPLDGQHDGPAADVETFNDAKVDREANHAGAFLRSNTSHLPPVDALGNEAAPAPVSKD